MLSFASLLVFASHVCARAIAIGSASALPSNSTTFTGLESNVVDVVARGREAVLFMPEESVESSSSPSAQATSPNALGPVLVAPTAPAAPGPTTTSGYTEPIVVGLQTPVLAPSASASPLLKGPIVATYYTDWTAQSLPPEQVDFDRIDLVDFAFSLPDDAANLKFTQDNSQELLDRLVTAAHAKNKRVKLSIGGWTGSASFSSLVASPESRQAFVSTIVQNYNTHHLDGVDIDWEYPGRRGQDGNKVSPQDTNNLLLLFQLLRAHLPPDAILTAVAQDTPFADENGKPLADASDFAAVLDYILIMNYDIWGAGNNPGPNAPLGDDCNNSTQSTANAKSAVQAWVNAKFPANKLVLGLPSYGYTYQNASASSRRTLQTRFPVGVVNEDNGSTTSGVVQFASLIKQGALQKGTNGLYAGAGGFDRTWDTCSSTPWLRSLGANQVISYDDPESIQLKSTFAKQDGLFGVEVFDAHGDTAEWELIDACRRGLGLIN